MTLTLKTALHAIDEYGKIFNIVDDAEPLSAYSVTREQAIESNKLRYQFTPCIVVTTARESLEAAWELAHVPEDGVISPGIWSIRREREDGKLSLYRPAHPMSAKDPFAERRLLDPPEPEPEPWELSRYCHADNEIFKRTQGYDGVYWARPGSETRYSRAYLAGRNPKPVTIEGEGE